LQSGADVELRDRDGNTALSLATKLHLSRIVTLLKNPPEQNKQKVVGDAATPSQPVPREQVPAAADDAKSNPLAAEVETLHKKSRVRAFYGLGLSMRLLQSSWPQNEKEAGGAAAKLLGDLREVGAPEDLIDLAQHTFTSLAYPQDNGNPELPPQLPVSELRKRLDAYCQSQPDGSFFYAAGGYSYELNLLGQYLATQNSLGADLEDAHRRLLPLSTGFAAQCAAILECKDRALGFFSNSVVILQKPTLVSEDGVALRELSNEIGIALGTQER
jgi:hypothetical protein